MTVDHLLKREDQRLGGLKQRFVRFCVVIRPWIAQSHLESQGPESLDEDFDAQAPFIMVGQNCLNAIADVNQLLEADLDRCHRRKFR